MSTSSNIMETSEKAKRRAVPGALPVTGGDSHHSQEDGEEDEEASRDTIDNGRGGGVGERVIGHASRA